MANDPIKKEVMSVFSLYKYIIYIYIFHESRASVLDLQEVEDAVSAGVPLGLV